MSEFKSINKFRKENFISNSEASIIRSAQNLSLDHIVKEYTSITYIGLEETMIDIGAYCKIEDDESLKPQKLYMLKVYRNSLPTDIVKIGISSNISKRIDVLNKHWKNTEYSFKLYRVSKDSSYNMLEIEKSIHTILRFHGKFTNLGYEIDGYTEIFKYSKWMDHLVFSSEDYTD